MKKIRALYMAGPGNAFATFKDWASGKNDVVTSHVPYSRMFYDACQSLGVPALSVCTFQNAESEINHEDYSIVRRSDLFAGRSGLDYYRAHIETARQNMEDARRFSANLIVLGDGTLPILYEPLRRSGVSIVQSLHCRVWCEDKPASMMGRVTHFSYRWPYSKSLAAILSTSDVVTAQIRKLAGGRPRPIVEFLPIWRPDHYGDLPEPDCDSKTLNVLFVGRVEENKGAYDLIEIAKLLRETEEDIFFHICGVGSALDTMKNMAAEANLSNSFAFHGWCDLEKLKSIMLGCQISIVPTKSNFNEGFNHVVVEAVLAKRPPVASSMCPAANYVSNAAEVVRADDIQGYAKALTRIARNRDEIRRRVSACVSADQPCLNQHNSYGTAVREVLLALQEERPVKDRLLNIQNNPMPAERTRSAASASATSSPIS